MESRVEKQMKSRWNEAKSEERRCNSAKVRTKKFHTREMLEKSRNAMFFQWFVCQVSRKVGSLKRRARSHVVGGKMKNFVPLWQEARFEVKMYKTHQGPTTFSSYDVEKLNAAVARSTFVSENVQNTSALDHFLKFGCRKNARRCGEKRISKWKCLNSWRHRSTFWSSDVKKFHTAVTRSICVSQNVQTTCVLAHFLKFRCWKISQSASSSVNQSVR